eukprot:COSAG02_NODE_421_length_22605_cov_158.841198_1_plen_830_part_10
MLCEAMDGVHVWRTTGLGAAAGVLAAVAAAVGGLRGCAAPAAGAGVPGYLRPELPGARALRPGAEAPETKRRSHVEHDDTHADTSGSELLAELALLRLMALRERAIAEGLEAEVVDDALDEDSPKAALISLIVTAAKQRGPGDRLLSYLSGGGDAAADAIGRVLEATMQGFEQLLVTSPRRSRAPVRELLENLERTYESVDAAWCDRLSLCGNGELSELVGHLLGVQALVGGDSVFGASISRQVSMVLDMLSCLRRCGNKIVQSVSLLRRSSTVAHRSAECIEALKILSGLCPERVNPESVCKDEAAAFELVMVCMSECKEYVGAEIVCGCMSLHTLGCRNGIAVCGESDEMLALSGGLLLGWYEHAPPSCGLDELLSAGAIGALISLASFETVPKVASDRRAILEMRWQRICDELMRVAAESRLLNSFEGVCDLVIKGSAISDEEISLECGVLFMLAPILYQQPAALLHAERTGLFQRVVDLHFRIMPSVLPDEWWVSTHDEIDVTSSRLNAVWSVVSKMRTLDKATLSSWWPQLRDVSIELLKLNSTVGLSERDTMCFWPIAYGPAVIVEKTARDESQRNLLLAAGVLEALEYGVVHDFSFMGFSASALAGSAAAALVGRQEGGRTLSRAAVLAVLEFQHSFFIDGSMMADSPVKIISEEFKRVVTISISDANKKHMVDFEPLTDMLLDCLLLDENNRRHGQEGSDALQEASAGVIQELSLFGPGCALLRAHDEMLSSLHRLLEVGTKVSQERAAAALFELDEAKTRAARPSSDGEGMGEARAMVASSGLPPPHVMASYNWDHQDVILRVVASLQERGYLVWVDTEQM